MKCMPIKGYEGIYEVSDTALVKRLPTVRKTPTGLEYNHKGNLLKLWKNNSGYYTAELSKNGVGRCFLAHRLVAEAFLPNTEKKPQVNHIDGNKTNNHLSNLEWCTNSENNIHATKNGLLYKGFNHHLSKLTLEQVLYIKQNHQKGVRGKGACVLAKKFGVSPSTISQIIDGRSYRNVN